MAEQIEINLAFRDTGLDSLQKDVAVLKKEMAGLYGESKNANGGISAIGKSGISSGAGFAALSASVLAAGKAIYEFAQAADQVKSVEKAFNRVFNGDTFTAQNKLSDLIRLSNELGIEAASLTDTYITLTSRGIKPTNDEIIKLLDLAKAQGKDIGQLTEAILDAQTGEFERLKEFGIKASKDGDSVKLSFRGITKEVNNSEEAIKNAIVGFGSLSGVQGTATSSADNMAAAQARLSNSMKLIASGIGDYFLPVVKDVIEGLGDFASGVSDIVNPIDASNRQFREQRELVSRLDQDLPSLVKRYEELTSKGKLNKTEQAELNQTISDISAIVPQAVNSLGDYGSALTVNLERIKSYTAEQKSLLLFTAQSGLVLARDKEKELSTSLKNYKDIIDAGGVARRTIIDLDGNETLSDPFDVSKETLRGAVEAGAQLTAIQKDIAEREAIIKSLTTGQKIEKEKIVTEIKKATGATDAQKEAAKKLKEEIEKLREQYKKLSDEINKRATEARVDINAAGAEDRVRRESEIRVKELEAEETQAKELAKKAKVKYDLDAQFAELRTVLALETAVKIRNARNKENGTDDEIKTLELRFATFQDLVKARQDVLDSISSGNESQIEKAKSEFERLKSAANPQDLIEFLAKFGDKFNELKIKIAQTAEDLRTPLEKLRDGIGKALGLDDKQLDIVISGIEELGSNLFAFFQQQNAAAAKAQEELAAQLAQRIGVQKQAYEKEKALAAEGLANSLGAEKDKLDKLEEQRAAALKKAEEERQKNVRLQLAQQAIEQTSNLITAGSNIIANFARFPIVGVILGIAALSSMLLAFSTFKSRVTATTKLRGGGRLKGNSHEFGGIDIGGGYEAEGGEWVVTKSVSEKHDAFINRLNNKEFDNLDLNTLLSRDNPVFGAGRSVRDAKKQTRQSVEIAQHNALKKMLREVIMEQTDALVSLENTRTHMVSTAEGYIEIKNDRRGGKTINKVRMV